MNMNDITKRLNWIDWAKAIAITFVVFGHIPEERDAFLLHYITFFHMPLFFFISGYLTKKEYFNKKTLKKYWHTLVVPYFIYNILFYPYWAIRHIIDFPDAGWYDFLKPIIGTLLLQHATDYYESLNGVTWFIAALLVMKIIFALCNGIKNGVIIIIVISILSSAFFIVNEYERFIIDLPPVGFTKCIPFFFLGYLCKAKNIVTPAPQRKDWIVCILGIGISLFVYASCRPLTDFLSYGIVFWIVCPSAILGLLSLCKLLNNIHSNIIVNISIGTIVILGFHWMLIGVTNFTFSKLLHLENGIQYPWYIAIMLALSFVAILYPVIIIFKKHFPFMLGKTTLLGIK